ncbi:hypothetical protein [Actinocorallia populi]|uniref:hypothetical protein n=1 Tax=Actinocorallia populi TaxID=2079200 RepID=UPI0013004737|nr:hypothetical protein [Actinocorallia populi]
MDDGASLYWDSMPLVLAQNDLNGLWTERDWRNVPGPFYGAMTDNCGTGRLHAPKRVMYTEHGQEIVYRQPQNPKELQDLLNAAEAEAWKAFFL